MSELAYNIVWSKALSLYLNTHDIQPRIIQVNEFVCLVGNKNLFNGLIEPYDSPIKHKILRNCFDVIAYYKFVLCNISRDTH